MYTLYKPAKSISLTQTESEWIVEAIYKDGTSEKFFYIVEELATAQFERWSKLFNIQIANNPPRQA